MFLGVQYLRGLAALLVAYYHLFGYDIAEPLSALEGGAFGVDIFFVVSGFVMWVTTDRDDASPSAFLRRRIVRVVPLYWLFTALLVLVALAAPGLAPRIDLSWDQLVKSLLFIPHSAPAAPGDFNHPILSQGWTLNYEIFFYGLFAASLLLRAPWRRLAVMAATFLALVAAGRWLSPAHPVLAVYTDPILLEFLLGMAIGGARRELGRLGAGAGLVLVAGGACLVVDHGFFHPSSLNRLLAFGPGSALLVAGTVALEPWTARRGMRLLASLGDASYALYLSHSFTIKAAMVLLAKVAPIMLPLVGVWLYAGLAATAALLAATTVAVLIHRHLERPLTEAAKAAWAARFMAEGLQRWRETRRRLGEAPRSVAGDRLGWRARGDP
jgi:exopolysaccharide production protein ExoZ